MTLTRLPNYLPFFTKADYVSYIARLQKMPDYMVAATKRIKTGLDKGWSQPYESMTGYEHSIKYSYC